MNNSDRSKVLHSQLATSNLYPIRTVSRLTGVNAVTLRAWERRYGLLKPHRTPKGHRLYSQADLDLIHQVVDLLGKGATISQVRGQLQQGDMHQPVRVGDARDAWGAMRQRMINAVVRFDQERLDEVYNSALSLYPVDVVTNRLIVPLLQLLGDRWASAQGSVAEEHFFGAYLRNKLGARLHHMAHQRNGPTLVAACLPGEFHEVGLLLFCGSAMSRDFRVVLLGANMPLDELPLVVEHSSAAAIVLSGTHGADRQPLRKQLPDLVADAGVPVLVGGGISIAAQDLLIRAGAIPMGDDVASALRILEQALPP